MVARKNYHFEGPLLCVDVERTHGFSLAIVAGEYTLDRKLSLSDEKIESACGGLNLFVDLTDVKQYDGTAVAELILVQKHLRKLNHRLIIYGASDYFRNLAQIHHVDEMFDFTERKGAHALILDLSMGGSTWAYGKLEIPY